MPVSLQQIQNLTDEILNTNVSQAMVNQTLKAAQNGLEQAREVEALSQRASKFKPRITCPSAKRPGFLTM